MTRTVTVQPIRPEDAAAVGGFLHRHLNPRVDAEAWVNLIVPPWTDGSEPNHGFQLLADGRIVGAYVAVYSDRQTLQGGVRICNLAAFAVKEEYRSDSFRLVRALLKQPGYEFTDLSPSGNVLAINVRLGFRYLDTSTRLVANLPWPPVRDVRVSGSAGCIAAMLSSRDADVYRDHARAPAARHLVVRVGDAHAYLMFRRSTRKRLPLFASPLYVGGDRDILRRAWPWVGSHLLTRHGLPATLAERRILGFTPKPGVDLKHPRPKMFRGSRLETGQVDYLYSELSLLEW